MSTQSPPTPSIRHRKPLSGVRKFFGLLSVGMLLVMLVGVPIILTFEEQYRATAWLQTRQYLPQIAFNIADSDPRDFGSDAAGYIKTQARIIRSPLILGPAVAELMQPDAAKGEDPIPELRDSPDPVDWLQTRLEVPWDGHSQLNTIPNPEHAARIVNEVVEQYLKLRGLRPLCYTVSTGTTSLAVHAMSAASFMMVLTTMALLTC
ncbi:MAG: hypothetical protein ACYTG0_41395 [Planctomycetota bacterium]|jgi:uncharacterized protein involved in exopolysaccharide biosynthesis